MSDKPKMTRLEICRLGALALNSNPEKKRAATIKAMETKRRKKLTAQLGAITLEQNVNEWKKLIIDKDKS